MEKNATQKLTSSIETKNFDEDNLIEIKTELNMPYVSDREYENAYGETVINGVHYQYVKRKIENNVMYLMCLPNNTKTALAETKTNLEKNNAETGNAKHKSPIQKILKSTQTEYVQNQYAYQLDGILLTVASILLNNRNNRLSSLFTPLTPEQPPQLFA
jgi:glutamate racemase